VWESRALWDTRMHAVVKCGGEGEPRYRIAYMPMRNRVETIRMMLEEAGVPYEFEVVGYQAWKKIKATTPLGKVPVLRNFDGKGNDLGQETAIIRFLGKDLGFAGKDPTEEALVDMLFTQLFCTLRNNGLTHDGEHYSSTALRDIETREGAPRYREMHRVNSHSSAERSFAALGVFEDQLRKTGTGFLVGNSLTYVDLALFIILFELAEDDMVPDFATRFAYPHLGRFLAAIESRPNIAAYLESKRRMPRYTRPGYVYCQGKYSPCPEDWCPTTGFLRGP